MNKREFFECGLNIIVNKYDGKNEPEHDDVFMVEIKHFIKMTKAVHPDARDKYLEFLKGQEK